MTNEEKARYEELDAKDCLIDDEDVIDYYSLRCEILEERLEELKEENTSLRKENQELAETLELYNEKFAGHERVKADLKKENQELKERQKDILNANVELSFDNYKHKKAIEILKGHLSLEFNAEENVYILRVNTLPLPIGIQIIKEKYDLINEVLGNE